MMISLFLREYDFELFLEAEGYSSFWFWLVLAGIRGWLL
jgi:hypothetical protein